MIIQLDIGECEPINPGMRRVQVIATCNQTKWDCDAEYPDDGKPHVHEFLSQMFLALTLEGQQNLDSILKKELAPDRK